MRFLHIACGAVLFCAANSLLISADQPQKRVVIDFEDVGTWRMVDGKGVKPSAWFAGGSNLGGSKKESRYDQYVGELKFAFDPANPGPYSFFNKRQKMTLISGFLEGIEFDADSKNLPVAIRFVLRDSAGKRFTTKTVPLEGGWKTYSLPINEETLKDFKDCRFPAHIEQIGITASSACEGSIFLDNITLVGSFARKNTVSIYPLYDEIAYAPGKKVNLRYRLRNARAEDLSGKAIIQVKDINGVVVYSGDQNVKIPTYGQTTAEFSIPTLPIGAYSADVKVSSGSLEVSYDDTFGVCVLNGKRLNRKTMLFGIQDTTIWNCAGENELHMDWMRKMGGDINRFGLTGGRLEPTADKNGYEAFDRMFKEHAASDVDIQIMYSDLPSWIGAYREGPRDWDAFTKHMANTAQFFAKYPNIKYFEFWNEPDIDFYKGNLEEYLKMLSIVYDQFKKYAPKIKITTGGVTVKHHREKEGFSEGMFKQGGKFYDVAAFHAHGPLSNYQKHQGTMEQWLKEAGLDNKTICNTETGERSSYDPIGRASQAVTLVKKFVFAKSNPKTEFYMWFTLQDYWDMDADADDSFGLVTSDNRAKPSFIACNNLIAQLANTTPVGESDLNSGIQTYVFQKEDGTFVYVCWPKPGSSGALMWLKSDKQLTRTNMYGLEEKLPSFAGMTPLSVGTQPVYLESASKAQVTPVAANDVFLNVPSEIFTQIGRAPEFTFKIKNPDKDTLTGSVKIEDVKGSEAWAQRLSIAGKAEQEFKVSLPKPQAGEKLGYTLVMGSASDKDSLKVPLNVIEMYSIARASGNPLDGKQDSFVEKLPVITVNQQQDIFERAFDPSIPPWKSPEDLSVQARVCHDGTGIYFKFDVTDDKFVPAASLEKVWEGDSVQVAVGTGKDKEYSIFNIGQVKGASGVFCTSSIDKNLKGVWDVPVKVERKGNITVYEVYVPFAKLGITPIAQDQRIRFSFLVNENDGQGRVRWMHWHDGIGSGGLDVDLLGYGVLEGK